MKNFQHIETDISMIYIDCLAYEEVAEVCSTFDEQLLLFADINEYKVDAEALQAFIRCQTTFRTIRALYGSIDAYYSKHQEYIDMFV
jgi:hypothetical protein